jgi:hypothetical protein
LLDGIFTYNKEKRGRWIQLENEIKTIFKEVEEKGLNGRYHISNIKIEEKTISYHLMNIFRKNELLMDLTNKIKERFENTAYITKLTEELYEEVTISYNLYIKNESRNFMITIYTQYKNDLLSKLNASVMAYYQNHEMMYPLDKVQYSEEIVQIIQELINNLIELPEYRLYFKTGIMNQ